MKLATWNINSLAVRLPQVLDWLAANPVDVLALQETKLVDEKFPRAEIEAAGYRVQWHGQKTYNGVALLSRADAQDVVKNIPRHVDTQARVIAATVDGVRVICAYVPNGQAPGTDKFEYKMQWLRALRDWVEGELAIHPRLVLMGDYNIAPEDRDVFDPELWRGQILCTDEERTHFDKLIALGLHDAFRLFEQFDVIVNGCDNFPTRYLVNDACFIANKPNVHGSIFQFEGQATVFSPHKGPCYRCLFPEPPPPGAAPSCQEAGVLGVLPGLVGCVQALETMKLILGAGKPLIGRMIYFDTLSMELRIHKLRKDPSCPLCGEQPTITGLIDYEEFCGLRAPGGAAAHA